MADISVNVRVVFANQEAVDAFESAIESLRQLRSEMPWESRLVQAVEDVEKAAESFGAIFLDAHNGIDDDFDDCECDFDDDCDLEGYCDEEDEFGTY